MHFLSHSYFSTCHRNKLVIKQCNYLIIQGIIIQYSKLIHGATHHFQWGLKAAFIYTALARKFTANLFRVQSTREKFESSKREKFDTESEPESQKNEFKFSVFSEFDFESSVLKLSWEVLWKLFFFFWCFLPGHTAMLQNLVCFSGPSQGSPPNWGGVQVRVRDL